MVDSMSVFATPLSRARSASRQTGLVMLAVVAVVVLPQAVPVLREVLLFGAAVLHLFRGDVMFCACPVCSGSGV